jgi:hypothetical protein
MIGVRKLIVVPVVAGMLILFAYGVLKYPDGPIQKCASHGYCGKQGQTHTERDYAQYREWQTTIAWTWPPGLLLLILLSRKRSHVPSGSRTT